ncbi:MAG TPA: prepilin-type N-terminal cleavage/methylation domain-containing protein [Gemmatimonadales bacterium]|nr:prepilin-type N-terminal cleavage/methylation domain-containing protein [Gemmatimonadales bacterium]
MRNRHGFTLIELMIALVLLGIVGGVTYQMLINTQRLSTAQAERMNLQSAVRTGALVVPSELREVGINAAGASDLVHIATDSVTYRAMRGVGFTCSVTATQIKLINSFALPFNSLRGVVAGGRDSLLIYVDNDPTTDGDDQWITAPVNAVAASTCGGTAAIAITTNDITGSISSGTIDAVIVGGPVRTFEMMRLKLYTLDGQSWLGAQSLSAGESVQPALGPLTNNGFELAYFDVNGNATTNAANVRSMQITLRGVTERPIARGGNVGANAYVQDSLVARVMLRNAPRL